MGTRAFCVKSHSSLPDFFSRHHLQFRLDFLVFLVPRSRLLVPTGGWILPGLYQRLAVVTFIVRPFRGDRSQDRSYHQCPPQTGQPEPKIPGIRQGPEETMALWSGWRRPRSAARPVGPCSLPPPGILGEQPVVVLPSHRVGQHRMGTRHRLEGLPARVLLVQVRVELQRELPKGTLDGVMGGVPRQSQCFVVCRFRVVVRGARGHRFVLFPASFPTVLESKEKIQQSVCSNKTKNAVSTMFLARFQISNLPQSDDSGFMFSCYYFLLESPQAGVLKIFKHA